ncbi:MAG: hypothetical protein GY772_17655, partial [bacterium]|nr:hypothetical protein [bacterium]
MRKAKATQEALKPSAGLMELEEWHALPERLDAAHRNSNIEVRLPGHVRQDLNDAKDNLCSRMHNYHREKTTEAQDKRLQGITKQKGEEARARRQQEDVDAAGGKSDNRRVLRRLWLLNAIGGWHLAAITTNRYPTEQAALARGFGAQRPA